MKEFVLFGYLAYQISNRNILSDCIVEHIGQIAATIRKANTFSVDFLRKNHLRPNCRKAAGSWM